MSTKYYDSQSGEHVEVPPHEVQVHVGLHAVPTDRVGAALNHLLLKADKSPIKGIHSVHQYTRVEDEGSFEAIADRLIAASRIDVAINVSDLASGIAATKAARTRGLLAQAILAPEICTDLYAVQLGAAELGDAGAHSILVPVGTDMTKEELRDLTDLACEVDLLGVPMRSRLGLRLTMPGHDALELARVAHQELNLLHFYTCLAGKQAPRPSDLLQALGVQGASANLSSMFLAEHVPDVRVNRIPTRALALCE